MDPKHPLSLQNQKLSQKDELMKISDYTIEPEKHEETVKNRVIGGLNNDAQAMLDLADQWSRSDQHIAIDSGKWRSSEAAI